MNGPLRGVRVVELGGMGPGPFGAMALSELGADVVRVDRAGGGTAFPGDPGLDSLNRGKRSIVLDLKRREAVAALLDLIAAADVVIDPFRPGVAERLGIGPDECLARNPRLVYARMTGWGQSGPRAQTAGHDINYISVTGALNSIGPHAGPPQIPLNLIGDFGGGGTYLIIGILAALYEVKLTGRGQTIDAAIIDGVSHLLTSILGIHAAGSWIDHRESNFLDGGAHYYHIYETSDEKFMAVGAIEPKFYHELLRVLGTDVDPARQNVEEDWPATTELFAEVFASRTQDQWVAAFEGVDACVTPLHSLTEAIDDPQMTARESITVKDGHLESAAAPRFSLYEAQTASTPPIPGQDTLAILSSWGIPNGPDLVATGAAHQSCTESRATETAE